LTSVVSPREMGGIRPARNRYPRKRSHDLQAHQPKLS
jgi:hypothetical protein